MVDSAHLLATFQEITEAVAVAFDADADRGLSGRRDTQYTHDVAADEVVVEMLVAAGLGVFSEESGLHCGEREIVVVTDPIDGSTNASRGVPWYAASFCATREGVPEVASVANLASGDRFTAVRGQGARRNGEPIAVRWPTSLAESIIALSGYPARRGRWEQFRVFGACALDMALVAAGVIDGFADADNAHGAWDYLASALIVEEAGGVVVDAFGRDLVTFDLAERRAPIACSNPALLDELVDERRRWE